MKEHPDHLTLAEEIPAILEVITTPQIWPSLPEAVLQMHAQGEWETRGLISSLYGTYLDIFALSGYLTRLVSGGELRAAHHFLMLLYVACRFPIPRALVVANKDDTLLRGYITGALCGFRSEERMLDERYAAEANHVQ